MFSRKKTSARPPSGSAEPSQRRLKIVHRGVIIANTPAVDKTRRFPVPDG